MVEHQALYRAWRPQTFADVTGQKHVTRTLQNALRANNMSHAYLFTGPRGVGKTTVAKILAKAVNCKEGIPDEPCNQCESCLSITSGRLLDVVEMDAASNRGVDEIRELCEKARYAPTDVDFKVYIIDEVHMLTKEAFNALLKTLEEPPAQVIFILATTEIHKVIATIVSRCQRFDFKRISFEDMVERLRLVSEQLQVEAKVAGREFVFEEQALRHIARVADGGLRDAISLLDQAVAFAGEKLTQEHVHAITGAADKQVLAGLIGLVADNSYQQVITEWNRLMTEGRDATQLANELLFFVRDLLVYQLAPEAARHAGMLEEEMQENQEIIDKLTREQLLAFFEMLAQATDQLRYHRKPRILVELLLLKMCQFQEAPITGTLASSELSELQLEVRQLQQQLKALQTEITDIKESTVASKEDKATIAHKPQIKREAISKDVIKLMQRDNNLKVLAKIKENWQAIIGKVADLKPNLAPWLADGYPVAVYQKQIVLAFKHKMHRETVVKLVNQQHVEEAFLRLTTKPFQLAAVMESDWLDVAEQLAAAARADDEYDDCTREAIELVGPEKVKIIKVNQENEGKEE